LHPIGGAHFFCRFCFCLQNLFYHNLGKNGQGVASPARMNGPESASRSFESSFAGSAVGLRVRVDVGAELGLKVGVGNVWLGVVLVDEMDAGPVAVVTVGPAIVGDGLAGVQTEVWLGKADALRVGNTWEVAVG